MTRERHGLGTRGLLGGGALIALQLVTSGYTGCQDRQFNGTTYAGNAATKAVVFAGRTDTPSATISVQHLRSPGLVPDTTPGNWTTARIIVGSNTALTWNDPLPYYDWGSTSVTLGHGTAWPLGGVLRLRTTVESPSGPQQLNAFDDDYQECSQNLASESWMLIGQSCESRYPRPKVTHIVSTARNPVNATTTPPYLTRKLPSFASTNLGAGYYNRIKVDQPNVTSTLEIHSLAGFKSRYGFNGSGVVSATYYNRGDLGLGREMNCREWSDASGNGVACYVTNFKGVANLNDPWGAFAPQLEQNALNDAIARTKSLATVAMVYNAAAPLTNYPDRVVFMVFNGRGAFKANQNRSDEALLANAVLDNRTAVNGDAVPSNCVTCHGGSVSVANNRNGALTGAYFLPFDLQAFRFSTTNSAYNRANQEEAFRKLNAMVLKTNVPTRIRNLVNGWYGGDVNRSGRTFDNNAIPTEWQNSGQVPYAETLYKRVFEPYCQGCHITQTGFPFARAADFVAAKPFITASVCGNANALNAPESAHAMPHAEMTMYNFWNSGARGHLMAALDIRGACN